MNACAFILARAGSKGLPGKNIIPFMGKPLIAWSIDAALECPRVDRVIVSTDGDEIADVSRKFGADVMMRPESLADDHSMPKDAIRYHLSEISEKQEQPGITILLQPTSPLREADDITRCVDQIIEGGFDSAATFVKSPSSPYRAWVKTEDGPKPFLPDHNPWRPRQALLPTFSLNGAVYAVKTDIFLADDSHSFLPGKNHMVEMPEARSIDIDTELDLKIAEAVKRSMK